jgi:hypothetical protein
MYTLFSLTRLWQELYQSKSFHYINTSGSVNIEFMLLSYSLTYVCILKFCSSCIRYSIRSEIKFVLHRTCYVAFRMSLDYLPSSLHVENCFAFLSAFHCIWKSMYIIFYISKHEDRPSTFLFVAYCTCNTSIHSTHILLGYYILYIIPYIVFNWMCFSKFIALCLSVYLSIYL